MVLTNNTVRCYNVSDNRKSLRFSVRRLRLAHFFVSKGVTMENILIEAKVNKKYVKFFRIFSILYFVFVITFPVGIMFLLMASGIKNQTLTVREDNVRGTYGKIFKRNIDLPLDSINSVEYVKKSGIVNISTSSQKIHFECLLNAEEISNVINELIRSRQMNRGAAAVINNLSTADELAKFKKLLDDKIITQEEFDAKKKQLLGL